MEAEREGRDERVAIKEDGKDPEGGRGEEERERN